MTDLIAAMGIIKSSDKAMLREVRALQAALDMSDAQLLQLARSVAGARVRCVEDLLSVELFELIEDLRRIPPVAVAA